MATIKDIKKRISSVRNTQQITKAMKAVAAAKLRRAHVAAVEARPYAEKMRELLSNLSARVSEESHPLLIERDEKRVDVLLITTDRGLCGAYNSNVIRLAESFRADHREKEVSFRFVGRKGAEYYRRRGITAMDDGPATWHAPADELASGAADRLIGRFLNGESDATYIIYSRFRSALSQVPAAGPDHSRGALGGGRGAAPDRVSARAQHRRPAFQPAAQERGGAGLPRPCSRPSPASTAPA